MRNRLIRTRVSERLKHTMNGERSWMRKSGFINLALLSCSLFLGCDQFSRNNSNAPPAPRATYAINELPDVEFNLPVLDDGRVRIPTPGGWHSGSRQHDRIVWFYYKDRSGLPRMIITANQAEEGAVETNSSNVAAFVRMIQARVETEQDLIEPAKGMQLGSNAWVRYVLAGRTKEGHGVDRQILKAIRAGREYTIELQVLGGTIHQFKTVAYAVAANITSEPKTNAGGDAGTSQAPAPVDVKAPNTATAPQDGGNP